MANDTMKIVAILAIAYILFSGGLGGKATNTTPSQTYPPAANTNTNAGYISTGATTVKYVVTNAVTGATITAMVRTSTNGAQYDSAIFTTSTGTASPDDKLDLLVNASSYLTKSFTGYTVPKAPTYTIPMALEASAVPTITMFNDANQQMTNNSYGATNQTIVAGGNVNMEMRLGGTDQKSSGKMKCIVEANWGNNVSSVVLSSQDPSFKITSLGKAKPSSYVLAGTTSEVYVFEVDPVVGAVTKKLSVGVTAKSAKLLAGSYLKTTCLNEVPFVDAGTGKLVTDIEDSQGTSQHSVAAVAIGYFQ